MRVVTCQDEESFQVYQDGEPITPFLGISLSTSLLSFPTSIEWARPAQKRLLWEIIF